MPYVSKKKRDYWAVTVQRLETAMLVGDVTPGEINYLVTKLLLAWIGPNPGYSTYNAAIGVLECIKLELYRRAVAPYEDKKCEENGDVYPPDVV
jgi:hypothetical protein